MHLLQNLKKTTALLSLLTLGACGPTIHFQTPIIEGPLQVEQNSFSAFDYSVAYNVYDNSYYYDDSCYYYDSGITLELDSEISVSQSPNSNTNGLLPFIATKGETAHWVFNPNQIGTYQIKVITTANSSSCGWPSSEQTEKTVNVEVIEPKANQTVVIEKQAASLSQIAGTLDAGQLYLVSSSNGLLFSDAKLFMANQEISAKFQILQSSSHQSYYALSTNEHTYSLPFYYNENFNLYIALADLDGDGIDEIYAEYEAKSDSIEGISQNDLPIYFQLKIIE